MASVELTPTVSSFNLIPVTGSFIAVAILWSNGTNPGDEPKLPNPEEYDDEKDELVEVIP